MKSDTIKLSLNLEDSFANDENVSVDKEYTTNYNLLPNGTYQEVRTPCIQIHNINHVNIVKNNKVTTNIHDKNYRHMDSFNIQKYQNKEYITDLYSLLNIIEFEINGFKYVTTSSMLDKSKLFIQKHCTKLDQYLCTTFNSYKHFEDQTVIDTLSIIRDSSSSKLLEFFNDYSYLKEPDYYNNIKKDNHYRQSSLINSFCNLPMDMNLKRKNAGCKNFSEVCHKDKQEKVIIDFKKPNLSILWHLYLCKVLYILYQLYHDKYFLSDDNRYDERTIIKHITNYVYSEFYDSKHTLKYSMPALDLGIPKSKRFDLEEDIKELDSEEY